MEEPKLLTEKRVIFLVLAGVELLDLAGPAQVFDMARRQGADYRLLFCAARPDLTSAQGLALARLEPLPATRPGDLIFVPGVDLELEKLANPLLDAASREWLRQAYRQKLPVASVCTGAFALAEAGLLDGRRCTSHWQSLSLLHSRYPQAHVQDNVLFVSDGPITTSAGVASGIDLALAILEKAQGPLFTAQVARHLLLFVRRNGTHRQQSIYLEYRTHLNTAVHQAQDFIIAHMTERISVEEIAEAARLSSRSLNRAFKEATGLTPIHYQQYLRLELAKTLLADSRLNLDAIAARCGFEDARHFRRLWKAYYEVAPSEARLELSRRASA